MRVFALRALKGVDCGAVELELESSDELRVAGVGTDILSVDRIRLCLQSPSFLTRTFTETEQDGSHRHSDPNCYYARVFSAKEAVFKCLGIAADRLSSWRDIEVLDHAEARPQAHLHGPLVDVARDHGVEQILVSWSSDTDYAVAFAVALRG